MKKNQGNSHASTYEYVYIYGYVYIYVQINRQMLMEYMTSGKW